MPPTSSTAANRHVARQRAPRTRPEDRRRQLLDVAEELLEHSGSDALRMDTLANAAGVTRPVVYSHFENRDGLIIALLERHAARIASRDDDSEGLHQREFRDLIEDATRSYLETSVEHGPAMRALVSGAHLSPSIEAARRRIWDSGVDKWSTKYSDFFDVTKKDARALALSHLTGLSAMAGMCMSGALSVQRATELHVACVTASLREVARLEEHP